MFGKRVLFVFQLLCALLTHPSPVLAGGEGCSQNMEIKDVRFSATSTVGVPVRFSDIGCAVIWRSLQCVRDQMKFDDAAVVRDYGTGREVPMEEAFFVINSGLQTPMGHGVAAFGKREEAESFVSENARGRVLTYAGLLEMKFE